MSVGRAPSREITHADRIKGLARYVCRMESRRERQRFIGRFLALHGHEMTEELRAAVEVEWKARRGS